MSDKNRIVNSQRMAVGSNFQIYEEDAVYYVCNKYKGCYRIAYLRMPKTGILMMQLL